MKRKYINEYLEDIIFWLVILASSIIVCIIDRGMILFLVLLIFSILIQVGNIAVYKENSNREISRGQYLWAFGCYFVCYAWSTLWAGFDLILYNPVVLICLVVAIIIIVLLTIKEMRLYRKRKVTICES